MWHVRGVSSVAVWMAVVLALVGWQAPADAAPVFDETKLVASDGAQGDAYGFSVAAADGRVVVGAHFDDNDNGPDAGSVYVYEPDGSGGWDETRLTATDGAAGDGYGRSVAVAGHRIVVGANGNDNDNGSEAGSVYLYEPDGSGGWDETKLTASDGADFDLYGWSVGVAGDRIVVGASGDDDNGSEAGSVYLYEPDGSGGWDETKLTASDGAPDDLYGRSVAVAGDRIVVGVSADDDNGTSSGSVYVYEPDGTGWDETKLTATDAATGDGYGVSVAVAGDRIVVGASADDDNGTSSGSAYVYEPDATGWDETKLTASDAARIDFYGISVAVAGDRVVVGAIGADSGNGDFSGSAYVYEPDGAGGWDETKLTATDSAAGDNHGRSVAVAGHRTVVGTPGDDGDGGPSSGSVSVYDEQVGDTTPPVVTVPADITAAATSLAGADVDYVASATDNSGVEPTLVCVPASGASFPVGTTTVTCTATDADGNLGQGSFDVTVIPPAGSAGIAVLVDGIEAMGLRNGVERSLTGRLSQAARLLDDTNPDNDDAVCDKLTSFDDAVGDRLADASLTPAQADLLTAYADALAAGLGCLPG